MTSLEDAGVGGERRARVEAALAADPDLAVELEAIATALGERAHDLLWAAFADECARCARPAAALLAALERVAAELGG